MLALNSLNPGLAACCLGLIAVITAYASPANEAVKIESPELELHRLTQPVSIHITSDARLDNGEIILDVIVDSGGNVQSSHAVRGPKEFFRQAESLEAAQKFKPFERTGVAVRAAFPDSVLIEQWSAKSVPFPEVRDWNSLRIMLTRDPCWMGCPTYSVTIHGDGQVEFWGKSGVILPGHHRATVSRQAVEDLLAAFRNVDYFSLRNGYRAPMTDLKTDTMAVQFDGLSKTVHDYAGLLAGMPKAARNLERAIDQAAGTERWIKESADTGKLLADEKWNLRSDSEENHLLLASVAHQGSDDLLRTLIAGGAQSFNSADPLRCPLSEAVRSGRLSSVKIFVEEQQQSKEALTCALGVAANSAHLDLVRYLIQKGGDPNGPLCGRYQQRASVLMNAVRSGNAEIVQEILHYHPDIQVKQWDGWTALSFFLLTAPNTPDCEKILNLLLAAGSDVNSRDNDSQTPLFHACNKSTELIQTLLQSGADVNAKDQQSQTVLMRCMDNVSLLTFIAAGADLKMLNASGHTAAQEARQLGQNAKAQLLETAAKASAH